MNEIKSQRITMCHGLARICRHTEVCRPNALARNAGPIIEKREKKAYLVFSSSWCNNIIYKRSLLAMASECTEVSTHHNANKRCSVLVPSTSVDVDGVHIKANSTLNKQGKQLLLYIHNL